MGGAIEGTVAILAELKAAGLPVFALTNWSAETYPRAEARFPRTWLPSFLRIWPEPGVSDPCRVGTWWLRPTGPRRSICAIGAC